MDLTYSDEERTFRDEVRAFLRDKLPDDLAEKVRHRQELGKVRPRALACDPERKGLAGAELAHIAKRIVMSAQEVS